MLELKNFLQSTEHKTGLVSVLLAVIAFFESVQLFVSETALMWSATGSALLLLLFKLFAPTGKIETGWKWTFYAGNILALGLGSANIFGDAGLISPEKLAQLVAGFNGLIAAFQILNAKKQLS